MPVNLVLIGPPGVGKGTQANLLEQRLGLVHLASGDIFRSEIANGTDLGRQAKEYIDAGRLVPDDLTISMMARRVTGEKARASGFVLDGFPRTVPQAQALDDRLKELETEITRVVALVIDDETVVERLSARRVCEHCGEVFHMQHRPPKNAAVCDVCGNDLVIRSDDKPETVRQRLKVYHEQTEPVLDYYRNADRLCEVDGDQPAEEVYRDVTKGLDA